ncbi:MAG TPA: threonine/serine dehydratase [Gemmatimonadaceae bacterium]|nr:threonine/serine dehydratase [Gemmatimonadaceae bacterium]
MKLTIADIESARDRIAKHVHLTPVLTSATLAQLGGVASVHLKCESFQKTGSFKVRGALNAILQLDDAARARGVVTVSAGNHAQAVAWAGRLAGARATVVMPAAASQTKAAASRGYGGEVILHGTGAEAFARAHELAKEKGFTLVHPFDDVGVAAGAGTVGLEIAEQVPDADIVIVPIGGGGLISGVAAAIRAKNPRAKVYGVEPEGAASMKMSVDAGRAVKLESPPKTIADGLAAPFAGELAYQIVRDMTEGVALVTDEEIAQAASLLLMRTKILAEPAGAAGLAALLTKKIPVTPQSRVVVIVSGGNVDVAKLVGMLGS